MGNVISYELVGKVGVITIDYPPVNAMGYPVRAGLSELLASARTDPSKAIILICAGRTFSAGADISEFGKPVQDPWLPSLVADMEAMEKPLIAAIHGTALGGGLETAINCHYRCAVASAKLGLPEMLLGLLPGATGTQRLPRLVGAKNALDMMLSGKPIGAAEALEKGAIDKLIDGDLREGAIAYAGELIAAGAPARRLSEEQVDGTGMDAEFFAEYRKRMSRATRGYFAPERIVQCVEAAVNLSYKEGCKRERALFTECMDSPHSGSMRHLFFAEREVAKIPDIPKDTPKRELKKVAVLGAGTMGGGIAMNFVNAGLPVTLLEMNQEGLERGIGLIRKNYEATVKKGRMSQAQLDKCMGLISGTTEYSGIADADLVVEAVFENMAVKKEVFAKLDEVCKPGAILASNTSTLDLNEIARVTRRPEDVIGLHFFAPANVMVLLEIVRGEKTAKDVVATCMGMAKSIRKVGVLVGVCFGFVGNRMFMPYIRESQTMLLEGASPEQIDKAAYDWGMAMGPNAVQDLSGLDVFYKLNQEWSERPEDPAYCRVLIRLAEMERYGQKTGRGFYRYEGRNAIADPQVEAIAKEEAASLGIAARSLEENEIVERLLYSMINEGALILEEGIALRPGDIDVIYANGYGLQRYRGGPMWYADVVGLKNVYDAILKYRDRYGDRYWTPAPLLEKLANEGSTFSAWAAGR